MNKKEKNQRITCSTCEIVENIKNGLAPDSQVVTLATDRWWYAKGYKSPYAAYIFPDSICFEPVNQVELFQEIKRQGLQIWSSDLHAGFFYVSGALKESSTKFLNSQGYYQED